MNPAAIVQLMQLKKKFDSDHPMFARFLSDIVKNGIPADSVIEISVKCPDGNPITTNMKVNSNDLEMIEALKNLGRGGL